MTSTIIDEARVTKPPPVYSNGARRKNLTIRSMIVTLLSKTHETTDMPARNVAIATRVTEDVAEHVETIAESPATDYETKSEVVASVLINQFGSH